MNESLMDGSKTYHIQPSNDKYSRNHFQIIISNHTTTRKFNLLNNAYLIQIYIEVEYINVPWVLKLKYNGSKMFAVNAKLC